MKNLLAVTLASIAFISCDTERKVKVEYNPPNTEMNSWVEPEQDVHSEGVEQPSTDSNKDVGGSLEIRIGGDLSKEDKQALESEIRKEYNDVLEKPKGN